MFDKLRHKERFKLLDKPDLFGILEEPGPFTGSKSPVYKYKMNSENTQL